MNEFIEPEEVDEDRPHASLEAFVASVQHLPLYTGIAAQLVRSVERDDITIRELSRQIATDAVLASQLLRSVNSAYYGVSGRIGTINDALAVLGLNTVRRIVIAAVFQRPLLAYLHDTPSSRAFWRHQLMCATLACFLHGRNGQLGSEVAYMAGLLHDVGRLAMLASVPLVYDELLEHSPDDESTVERERRRFGFDHAQVGATLLAQWNVPEQIVLAAQQHVEPVVPADPTAASVWHANRLAHQLTDRPLPDGDAEDLMQEMGLTAFVRQQIIAEVDALAGH